MSTEDPKLIYCTVTVTEGTAVAKYRWEGSLITGADMLDDDVSTWTDDEIREIMALSVGIEEKDRSRIDVVWD